MTNRIQQHLTGDRHESAQETGDINVVAIVKGGEKYIFLYNDANRAECLRRLGLFASNPDLSFTWYDAACLSNKIREQD